MAEQFCLENELDDETVDKLEDLLKQQIAAVLSKIDEDESDPDDYGSQEIPGDLEDDDDGKPRTEDDEGEDPSNLVLKSAEVEEGRATQAQMLTGSMQQIVDDESNVLDHPSDDDK